jgi:hypothetical protein
MMYLTFRVTRVRKEIQAVMGYQSLVTRESLVQKENQDYRDLMVQLVHVGYLEMLVHKVMMAIVPCVHLVRKENQG